MKLKFNNNFQSSDFKKRVILIPLLVILLLSLVGFITYQTLELLNTDPDISNFKAELESLTTVQQEEASTNKIVENKLKSPEISIYGNQLTDISPFYSLLRAVPEEPETSQEGKSKSDSKQTKSATKKQEKKTKAEIKQEIKNRIQNNLQILGILETNANKVAIVQYGDKSSQTVEEGMEFAGLKVKKITKDRLIIKDKKSEFTYTIGGEED